MSALNLSKGFYFLTFYFLRSFTIGFDELTLTRKSIYKVNVSLEPVEGDSMLMNFFKSFIIGFDRLTLTRKSIYKVNVKPEPVEDDSLFKIFFKLVLPGSTGSP